MVGLIGKKVGMSQYFMENGSVVPVSLIEAGPCPIVQIKDEKRDGYKAIQIGFGTRKKINKPLGSHIKRAKLKTVTRLIEIKVENLEKYKVGDQLDVSIFSNGDKVSVAGWTKGRGFSGGIKRWGWSGGPMSHGSMSHRRIGSSGPGTSPGRIWKNKTMPGRYGHERVTVKNAKIMKIEKEKNMLYIKGAVPGPRNGYIIVVKKAE
jgi:large subunit ribosomal protein L3